MDEDLRKLVEEKVSKWFGEPVLAVEDEIMALIASYTSYKVEEALIDGRVSGLNTARRYRGNGFEVSQKIDKEIRRLKNLKEGK
jgi:hypothetical protein